MSMRGSELGIFLSSLPVLSSCLRPVSPSHLSLPLELAETLIRRCCLCLLVSRRGFCRSETGLTLFSPLQLLVFLFSLSHLLL